MDEPSAQLHLDLTRAVQHELATRRPLLHRLRGSGWVLQLPRPANAVRHGSRFYYNILVNPHFARRTVSPKSLFSQPSPSEGHLQTTAELEGLLRDLEILASSLRAESNRKSNFTVEDEVSRLETLVDAVAITELDESNADSYRDIHPDVPVFTSHHHIGRIARLRHFRTLGTMATFGEGGCRDWRSITAVAGMPEWVGIGLVPAGEQDGHEAAVMIAFNNHHSNCAGKLAEPKSSACSRQKRHAAIIPDEEKESAEVIVFTTQKATNDVDGMLVSSADPPIYLLAVVHLVRQLPSDADEHDAIEQIESRQRMQPAYRITERNNMVIDKGRGFLAWLIAKATFSTKTGKKEDPRMSVCEDETTFQGSSRVLMSNGESMMLI